MIKKALVIRGLPGSGKSTLASMFEDLGAEIYSTDNLFTDAEGNYNFDPSKLGEYHAENFEDWSVACRMSAPFIVLDNTNTQRWEFEQYVKVAEENGYQVTILHVEADIEDCIQRNMHNVPEKNIRRMKDRWELAF